MAAGPVSEAEARALLRDYTYVLDGGPLSKWPECFTEGGRYEITTRENRSRGYPLPIMLCDNRAMMFDRVEATERANIYEPHCYRHILSDSQMVAQADGVLVLRTSFICVRTMVEGSMMLFVAGEYLDEVVREGGRCLFRSKIVVVDASRIDTLIAIPL